MDDTLGSVRDAAAEALGAAMKLVGERSMAAYLDPIDKLKQEKVSFYMLFFKNNWLTSCCL